MTKEVVEIRECDQCKETLEIVRYKYELPSGTNASRVVALEMETGERHVCWDLPQDANLLVLND
jgi:hypothetical protein